MIDCISREECVGCKACGDVCPRGAISYEVNNEGFWFPVIDNEKCVKCGLCERVCPVIHFAPSKEQIEIPSVYAAYHVDQTIRVNSTSGGLYYALAKAFLEVGGYIAGCVYNDGFDGAHHIVSNSDKGLKQIMRSKYFQSDTDGIYKAVKQLLQQGNKVMFCGSPCQVAAMNNFLGGKYRNYYSVDFVCRGINSPLAFRKFMEELRTEYKSDIKEVHFKCKDQGWTNLGTKVIFDNGGKYFRTKVNDPWVNGFIVGDLYMRLGCSQCKFKNIPRVSDVSLGDFWGRKFTTEEAKYGVSLALINSDNGRQLLDNARKALYLEKRTLKEALEGNPALLKAVTVSNKRAIFFERINKGEKYSVVVWDLIGKSRFRRWIDLLKQQIRVMVR